jgi:L-amino acid N-acyltransferase YncA
MFPAILVSGHCAYVGVAEVGVYIAASYRGQGTGKILLNSLIAVNEATNILALQTAIFPEIVASRRRESGYIKYGKLIDD